ncbi:MAG: hypothetical protein F6K35_08790 [Okeania sp. SIO2H7]|nr:hypothetical protein [Okeania sp. SIO2H7]
MLRAPQEFESPEWILLKIDVQTLKYAIANAYAIRNVPETCVWAVAEIDDILIVKPQQEYAEAIVAAINCYRDIKEVMSLNDVLVCFEKLKVAIELLPEKEQKIAKGFISAFFSTKK